MTRNILLAFIAASCATMLPFLLFTIGGDRFVYEGYLHCYADALAQGDIYPRWCTGANSGLGAPVFMFYPPLAYALTAPFALLIGTPVALILILWACGLLAGVGAYAWLRTLLSEKAAVVGGLVYMLTPYASSLRVYHSTPAEALAYALLPFIMWTAGRIVRRQKGGVPMFALLYGALILSHPSSAVVGGIAAGIYVLALQPRRVMVLALAAALSCALSAIYWLPALYYQQFVTAINDTVIKLPLENGYPTMELLTDPNKARLGIGLLLTVMLILSFGGVALLARRHHAPELRREVLAWCVVTAVAMVLFSPLLKTWWEQSTLLRSFFFPWRMQAALALALAFFAAVWAQKGRRTGDIVAILMLLLGTTLLLSQITLPSQDESIAKQRVARAALGYEYHTRWTSREKELPPQPLITTLAPRTRAEVVAWNTDELNIDVHAAEEGGLLLGQRYFPSWRSNAETLTPEDGSGLMRVTFPAGDHRIVLTHAPYAQDAWWVRLAPWLSLITLISILIYCTATKCGYDARNNQWAQRLIR